MKRTLVYGAATAAVALSLGAAAGLSACMQAPEALYGPPPSDANSSADEPVETLYGVPADEDDDLVLEPLYGVPADEPDEPIEDLYGPAPA